MKKLISSLSLFLVLGYGAINTTSVKANSALLMCFYNLNKPPDYSISGQAYTEDYDYYLVRFSSEFDSYRNVIKVAKDGRCEIVLQQQQILIYPLSKFLGKEVAYSIVKSKYLKLRDELGGIEPLKNALLGELEADAPHIFFEDTVIVLKELGIDLAKETPNLIIVGEEGIPGHPELQFKE